MGLLDRFQEGDGWEDPIVSGFDVALEMIADHMEESPEDYTAEDIEFLMNFDWLNKDEHARAYKFCEDWVEARYCQEEAYVA